MASSWLKMGERPSEKGVVVLGNPIYPFQTAYQIIVRTVHKSRHSCAGGNPVFDIAGVF